jgi:hypothetical protein
VAIVSCPKCPTGLRIPDGVSGTVKCPKCSSLFPVTTTAVPASATVPKVPQPVPEPISKTTTTQLPHSNSTEVEESSDPFGEPNKRKSAANNIQDDEESDNERKKRDDSDEDSETSPRKKGPQSEDEVDQDTYARWMSVSRGFNYIHWAPIPFFITFICSLVLTPLVVSFGAGAGVPPSGVSNFASMVMGIISFVSPVCSTTGLVLCVIGCIFCVAIPEKARPAKQLIVVSMSMFVVSTGIQGLSSIVEIANLNLGVIQLMLGAAAGLLMLGAQVTLLLFAKSTAEFLRKNNLAQDATSILTQCLIFTGCFFFVTVLTASLIGTVGGGANLKNDVIAQTGARARNLFVTRTLLVGNIALVIFASKILTKFFTFTDEMSDAIEEHASAARSANRAKRQRQRKQKAEKEYGGGDEIKVVDYGED